MSTRGPMSRHPSLPRPRPRRIVAGLFVAIVVAGTLPGLASAQDASDPRRSRARVAAARVPRCHRRAAAGAARHRRHGVALPRQDQGRSSLQRLRGQLHAGQGHLPHRLAGRRDTRLRRGLTGHRRGLLSGPRGHPEVVDAQLHPDPPGRGRRRGDDPHAGEAPCRPDDRSLGPGPPGGRRWLHRADHPGRGALDGIPARRAPGRQHRLRLVRGVLHHQRQHHGHP